MAFKHYFITNRDSNITYLYFPTLGSKFGYERFVYIPEKFETMTQKEIQTYKKNTVFKFILWTLLNHNEIQDPSDSRAILSRFIDINSYIMMVLIAGLAFNRFFKRVDLPFLQMMLQEKIIKPSYLRVGGIATLSGLGVVESVNHVCSQAYLFDMMLKYKERFIPNTLYSSNCEDLIKYSS